MKQGEVGDSLKHIEGRLCKTFKKQSNSKLKLIQNKLAVLRFKCENMLRKK